MTIYDADCNESRVKLSESLIEMLESSGFQEVKVWGTREIVYERHIDGADRMRVRVYTSLADSYYDGDAMPRYRGCLLYTSPSPRDGLLSRMPSSA